MSHSHASSVTASWGDVPSRSAVSGPSGGRTTDGSVSDSKRGRRRKWPSRSSGALRWNRSRAPALDPGGDLVGPTVHPGLGHRAVIGGGPRRALASSRDRGGEPAVQHLVGIAVVDGLATRRTRPCRSGRRTRCRGGPPGPRALGGVGGEVGDQLAQGRELDRLDDQGGDRGHRHVDRRSGAHEPVHEAQRADDRGAVSSGPCCRRRGGPGRAGPRPGRSPASLGGGGKLVLGRRAEEQAPVEDAHGERCRGPRGAAACASGGRAGGDGHTSCLGCPGQWERAPRGSARRSRTCTAASGGVTGMLVRPGPVISRSLTPAPGAYEPVRRPTRVSPVRPGWLDHARIPGWPNPVSRPASSTGATRRPTRTSTRRPGSSPTSTTAPSRRSARSTRSSGSTATVLDLMGSWVSHFRRAPART